MEHYTDTVSKRRGKPARPFQKAGICVFDLNWVFCALGGEMSTLNQFSTLFQATATYYVNQYTKTCKLIFFTNNNGIFCPKTYNF